MYYKSQTKKIIQTMKQYLVMLLVVVIGVLLADAINKKVGFSLKG